MSNWNKSAEQWRGAWAASKRPQPKERKAHAPVGTERSELLQRYVEDSGSLAFSHGVLTGDSSCSCCGYHVCSRRLGPAKAPEKQQPATKLVDGSREWAAEMLTAGAVLGNYELNSNIRFMVDGGMVLRSSDCGLSWRESAFHGIRSFAAAARVCGWHVAADPTPSAASTTPAKMNGEQAVAWMLANPGKELTFLNMRCRLSADGATFQLCVDRDGSWWDHWALARQGSMIARINYTYEVAP